MRDVVLVVIVLVLFAVSLRRPFVGAVSFLGCGILNPGSFTWAASEWFHISQLLAIGTLIGYLVSSEPKRFPHQREVLLLLALWGIFGFSSIFAIFPERAVVHFTRISKIFFMLFVSMSLINTEYRLHLLLRVIAFSLGFFALKGGIFFITTGGQQMVWGPENSFLEANNSIGLALAMNVPLLFYLAKSETKRWLRLLIWAMIVFSYPAVIGTFSRGAWLGLAAASVLVLLRSQRKVLTVSVAALLIVMALPFWHYFTSRRIQNRYEELVNYEEDTSAQSRFWTWEFCKRVGMANPLTGGGFELYSWTTYEKYYPEFLIWRGKVATCHGTWMQMFAEHGFPGFIVWNFLLICCFSAYGGCALTESRAAKPSNWFI